LENGPVWDQGDKAYIWTGYVIRPAENTWILNGGAYNRRAQVKTIDLVYADSQNFQPLFCALDLKEMKAGSYQIAAELGCLLGLQPGVEVKVAPVEGSTAEIKAVCDFFDDQYYEQKKTVPATGKYRALGSSRNKPIQASSKKEGRSFYTLAKLAAIAKEAKNTPVIAPQIAAEIEAEEASTKHNPEDIKEVREKRHRRADESRLCKSYVLPFLRALYHTDSKPKDYENAFVVQDQRPSTDFRNVDLLAVHWRTHEIAELVTVEAKLGFTSQLVQQAANYSRFSHRVWIAVVVEPGIEVEEIVASLKEEDELLFEYVLSLGLGVIACQKGRGGSFNCYAIQWPRKQQPDNFEKMSFMECYRETFEEAGLLERQKRNVKIA